MQGFSKLLIAFGVLFVLAGITVRLAGGKLGWLGHLPGDLRFGHVYIPLATCLLVSVVATLVVNLIVRIFRF